MISKRPAFTLVEIMMASSVLTLIGGAVVVLTQTGRNAWLLQDQRYTSLLNAQRVMNQLTIDLRQASAATVSCSPNLAFSLDPDFGGTAVSYAVDDNNQLARMVAGAPQVVAAGVSAFTPSCLGNGVVRLVFSTIAESPGVVNPGTDSFTSITHTVESQVWVPNP